MIPLLEDSLHHSNYNFVKQSTNSNALAVDFMSAIRKISPIGMFNIKNMLSAAWNLIKSTADANHIHIVYDSYLKEPIKESK